MATAPGAAPILADGMRLTRDEFIRRWELLPDLKLAELIDGVVRMPSPVSAEHADGDITFAWLVFNYMAATPGTRCGTNATWLMAVDGAPQPDVYLAVRPECGGRYRVQRGLLVGSPELVAEVSLSTAANDLGPKREVYRRHGVDEYVVILPRLGRVIWHRLGGGQYRALEPGDDGVVRSEIFPGLWVDPAALLAGDDGRLDQVLRAGLGSPEHAAFAAGLAAARG